MKYKNSVNEVTLIGFVGVNPETRYTANGMAVANFSLGTTRPGANNQEMVDWHRIVAFGKMAESIAMNVVKGRRLYIAGRLSQRSWVNEAGENRHMTEIIVENIVYLDAKRPEAAPQRNTADTVPETTEASAPVTDNASTVEDPDELARLVNQSALELV